MSSNDSPIIGYKIRGCIILFLLIWLVSLPIYSYFHHRVPAPGYILVTNGDKWSFKYPDSSSYSGKVASTGKWFKQSAINHTWWDYETDKEFERVKSLKWKEVH
jgi:hypothetical protein